MRSWRCRGFNKTTNRGAKKDEEPADRTLFHLLNLIMEICNVFDCFAVYVFALHIGVCVFFWSLKLERDSSFL